MIRWIAPLIAVFVAVPAFAGWQPLWRFVSWEPAHAEFPVSFPVSDGGIYTNYLGNTNGNIINQTHKPIAAGQKVRIRGFGAVVGDPDTRIDDCDLAVRVGFVVQPWSIIKFGTGRTASASCLVAPPGGDLNVTGETCWVPAPKPYLELTWNPAVQQQYKIIIGDADTGDAGDCLDDDMIDSVQWALFVEVSE